MKIFEGHPYQFILGKLPRAVRFPSRFCVLCSFRKWTYAVLTVNCKLFPSLGNRKDSVSIIGRNYVDSTDTVYRVILFMEIL